MSGAKSANVRRPAPAIGGYAGLDSEQLCAVRDVMRIRNLVLRILT